MEKLYNNLVSNKEYIIVNLENPQYNIEGILNKIIDKSFLKYKLLPSHITLFNQVNKSHFTHAINEIITHGICIDGWYDGKWEYYVNNDFRQCVFDILYYDEFIFLLSEDLILFDSFKASTIDDIWNAFDDYIDSTKEDFLQPLFNSKNIEELKAEYKKLIFQYHPDITGFDNNEIRIITATYLTIRKKKYKN